MKNDKTILISADLYQKLEKRPSATGFNSMDKYVTFILEQVMEGEAP